MILRCLTELKLQLFTLRVTPGILDNPRGRGFISISLDAKTTLVNLGGSKLSGSKSPKRISALEAIRTWVEHE